MPDATTHSKTPPKTPLWQSHFGITLMGILNVTPDSFSDGGQFAAHENALAQALTLQEEGAHILDIGGESTRPNAKEVPVEEEIARVVPIIKVLKDRIRIPISIDTYKAQTADQALQAGAKIVNDIWGLQRDPQMAEVVAAHSASVVIMHNRQEADPETDILHDIAFFFEQSLTLAHRAGIKQDKIILDPGIGFGKTQPQNLEVLQNIRQLKTFGYPILIGASRKSLIGFVTGSPVHQRLPGTLATHLHAIQQGADIIRVHDMKAHYDALVMMQTLSTEWKR